MSEPISQPTASRAKPPPELAITRWGRMVYALMLIAVGILTFSGVGTFVSGYAPMTHWVLMAHVAAAPVFAIGLAFVALTWSDRCRFGCERSRQSRLSRALFWLVLASGLAVILSGVTPMLPIFGTDGQHLLYLTHRYAGLTLACAVTAHWLSRRERS
jgi:hypothetical protein